MDEKTNPRPPLVLQQTARWLPADMDTPISLFLDAVGAGNGILLESAEVDGRWGRYSLLACDIACILSCGGGKLVVSTDDASLAPLRRFGGLPFVEGLRGLMKHLHILPPPDFKTPPPITRALYGYMGFGMAGLFNAGLAAVMPPDEAECLLVLPGTVLLFDHLYNRLCRISLGAFSGVAGLPSAARAAPHAGHASRDGQGETTSEPDEAGYKDYVVRIKKMLRRGEAIQVVPSARFSTAFTGDAFTLYRRMRRHNASPYMFYMRFSGLTLLGSSPEIMVRCADGLLQLSPIAGTRRRGKDDTEDALLAAELREDPKERAEHVMLVDLGRNDLGRVARPGSVNLERYMEVERFSHVMHLTSRVTARLADGLDALDVLAATFPAGTVSGAPKVRAMEIIRELEGRPRGPYAGCIGWIGLDGESVNLDMGIAIRSMWARGGKLFWQAGGGIVHDSDPELEWKEVCDKSAIMRMAVQAGDEEYVPDNR
ncbi:MAG: anthranilate synthase component I family protein [Desulfovibrio sp.]|jgi:anthranilate synthase component 1|nr:anthranilate synthase component I family protein [Desulfovibrio sp.]